MLKKLKREEKPGLMLIKPASHVALTCPSVTTKYREGELSISAFYKLRPRWVKNPSMVDGLCHHYSDRRNQIGQIHKLFPKQPKF